MLRRHHGQPESGDKQQPAFVLAEQGRNDAALAAALRAMALRPASQRYRQNVNEYARAAGVNPKDLSCDPAWKNPGAPVPGRKWNLKAIEKATGVFGEEIQNIHRLLEQNQQYYGRNFEGKYPGLTADFEKKLERISQRYDACHEKCQDSYGCNDDCQCSLSFLRESYLASVDCYNALAYVLEEWQKKDLNDLEAYYQRTLAALNAIEGLSPYDYCEYMRGLHLDYDSALDRIESHSVMLDRPAAQPPVFLRLYKRQVAECGRELKKSEKIDPSQKINRRPPVIKRSTDDSGREWNIWLGVGSITVHPNGAINLDVSITPVISGKLMYNTRTYDMGVGLGIGLTAKYLPGQAAKMIFKDKLKLELVISYDTAKGVTAGLDAGLSPKYGAMPGKPTAQLEIFR